MGATWFVSYAYYQYIDSTHKNWTNILTVEMRSNMYNHTKEYHEFWLQQVLLMNDKLLNTNRLELKAPTTKFMAKAVLNKVKS